MALYRSWHHKNVTAAAGAKLQAAPVVLGALPGGKPYQALSCDGLYTSSVI